MSKKVLVSGGAGYIGSHTCVELLNAGYDIIVADNYYNSCPLAVERVKQITGKDFRFYEADMTVRADVQRIFEENADIDAVIQFAAYKACCKNHEIPYTHEGCLMLNAYVHGSVIDQYIPANIQRITGHQCTKL